jgi:hypothetical protein
MYLIAIVLIEAETKDSWTWFLECLISYLGSHERHTSPTFISDRQNVSYITYIILHIFFFFNILSYPLHIGMMQGLVPSFDVVMPMVDHRICVRHLYANFRDKGFRGVALKELLWGAASSYTEADFRHHMEELRKINLAAFDYLDKIDPADGQEHGSMTIQM